MTFNFMVNLKNSVAKLLSVSNRKKIGNPEISVARKGKLVTVLALCLRY